MKGLVLVEPGNVAPADLPEPPMARDRVLVEVDTCTICGGEIKAFRGTGSSPSTKYPRHLNGHEFSGRILEVGSDVTGFAPGDHVAICLLRRCGFCVNCRLGHPEFCTGFSSRHHTGAYAERVSVHVPAQGSGLFKIPEAIDIQHAALAEPAACALGAAFLAEARLGDFVAVVGLGGLGQFIAQVLNASGARVIGIDVQPKKLEVAKRYCEFVVDAGQTDPVAVTLAITSGVGVDRAVEAVGLSSTLIQAVDLLRMGGRLVLAGVFSAPIQGFSLDKLFRKSITVVPAKGPMRLTNPAGAPLVFDYMARGILDPGHLLTSFALEDAQRAFLAQAQGDAVKAGIRPGSGPRGS